jgi:hypothetical protein
MFASSNQFAAAQHLNETLGLAPIFISLHSDPGRLNPAARVFEPALSFDHSFRVSGGALTARISFPNHSLAIHSRLRRCSLQTSDREPL